MKFRHIIAALLICFAAGCFEMNEDIVINKDGSGNYSSKMDMSAMLQMMQTMASDELEKNGVDKSIDTVIKMKDILDSAKDATPEQKRLLKDGSMRLQMNLEQSILKADINFPFKSYEDLALLLNGATTGSMGNIFKRALTHDTAQAVSPGDAEMDQINSIFDVTVNNKQLTRKLNKEKYDAFIQRPEMAQMKELAANGMEIQYTTTIRLPRPVKKSDNPMIKLSPDKKTVTIKYDMVKLFQSPEQFSYSIEY
ncbi:MAG: hypothetical protein J7497_07355 [Chitinophagaceae bacterium]|nr:hypothetical protein [Chitinophagaceae bacterium]